MRQKLIVIHQDETGKRGRVTFTQGAELEPMKFTANGLEPSEVVKLCMLMHSLADVCIQNLATAKNEGTAH